MCRWCIDFLIYVSSKNLPRNENVWRENCEKENWGKTVFNNWRKSKVSPSLQSRVSRDQEKIEIILTRNVVQFESVTQWKLKKNNVRVKIFSLQIFRLRNFYRKNSRNKIKSKNRKIGNKTGRKRDRRSGNLIRQLLSYLKISRLIARHIHNNE